MRGALKYKKYEKIDKYSTSGIMQTLKMHNEEVDYNWKSTITRQSKLNQMNVKCKHCGHSVFPIKDKNICTHCGHWVYKNDKIEFEYKLKEYQKNIEIISK